jgi:alpha-beta hydrolase superfamily lysophospholipase
LLTFINQQTNNHNKWIAIGHSMGGGCVLNMNDRFIKRKLIFNPAIKPIISNFFKLGNKQLVFLLKHLSNKKWFMDNVLAFVDKKRIDAALYRNILEQIPDSFTMIKTLIEGFDTENLNEKNKDIPVHIWLSKNDTVVGNHEILMSQLLTLPNVTLAKVVGTHIYMLHQVGDVYEYIIGLLKN